MHIQLYEQSIKNNIIGDEQFGFRTKSAINNAIYNLINKILTALSTKLMIEALTASFDTNLADVGETPSTANR